jgi:hypothetical protein
MVYRNIFAVSGVVIVEIIIYYCCCYWNVKGLLLLVENIFIQVLVEKQSKVVVSA